MNHDFKIGARIIHEAVGKGEILSIYNNFIHLKLDSDIQDGYGCKDSKDLECNCDYEAYVDYIKLDEDYSKIEKKDTVLYRKGDRVECINDEPSGITVGSIYTVRENYESGFDYVRIEENDFGDKDGYGDRCFKRAEDIPLVWSDWIELIGEKRPVSEETLVQLKHIDGHTQEAKDGYKSKIFEWDKLENYITHYKVQTKDLHKVEKIEPKKYAVDGSVHKSEVTEFKAGYYYRVKKRNMKRPESFNSSGQMDFLLDGEWHKCLSGADTHADFSGFERGKGGYYGWEWECDDFMDCLEESRQIPSKDNDSSKETPVFNEDQNLKYAYAVGDYVTLTTNIYSSDICVGEKCKIVEATQGYFPYRIRKVSGVNVTGWYSEKDLKLWELDTCISDNNIKPNPTVDGTRPIEFEIGKDLFVGEVSSLDVCPVYSEPKIDIIGDKYVFIPKSVKELS